MWEPSKENLVSRLTASILIPGTCNFTFSRCSEFWNTLSKKYMQVQKVILDMGLTKEKLHAFLVGERSTLAN